LLNFSGVCKDVLLSCIITPNFNDNFSMSLESEVIHKGL